MSTEPKPEGLDLSWPLAEYLSIDVASSALANLSAGWQNQLAAAGNWTGSPRLALSTADDDAGQLLASDLLASHSWFDPTATGNRLRRAIGELNPWRPEFIGHSNLVFQVTSDAWLVTPEGRAAMWCMDRALVNVSSESDLVWLARSDLDAANQLLLNQYRRWSQQRLTAVSQLLMDETSTLRPTAAGLLLVLLINRNTSADRAVPRPRDPDQQAAISAAIAAPALAYAHSLVGRDKASDAGTSLFGGWALGELSRRLGTGLETGDAIFIRPGSVDRAEERLLADIRQRPKAMRARVPAALQAALDSYELYRPKLNALGLAHERPAHTAALTSRIVAAATESGARL